VSRKEYSICVCFDPHMYVCVSRRGGVGPYAHLVYVITCGNGKNIHTTIKAHYNIKMKSNIPMNEMQLLYLWMATTK
jgi:hypothetical protein